MLLGQHMEAGNRTTQQGPFPQRPGSKYESVPRKCHNPNPERIPEFTPKLPRCDEKPCSGKLDLAEVLAMMDVC